MSVGAQVSSQRPTLTLVGLRFATGLRGPMDTAGGLAGMLNDLHNNTRCALA